MKEKVTLPSFQKTKDALLEKKLHLSRLAFYGRLQ